MFGRFNLPHRLAGHSKRIPKVLPNFVWYQRHDQVDRKFIIWDDGIPNSNIQMRLATGHFEVGSAQISIAGSNLCCEFLVKSFMSL